MPWICKNCKNKDSFEKEVWGNCTYTDNVYLNEQLDEVGRSDSTYDNYDNEDDDGSKCSDCDSEDIEEVTQEEWDAWNGPIPNERQEGENWQDYMKRRLKTT